MADKIRFKRMEGPDDLLESEFFEFTKNEVIQFFKSHKVHNINVFKKIEKNKPIVISFESGNNIKYLFHPGKNSEDYVFHIWKPPNVTNYLFDEIIELLKVKESQNLTTNNKNPWIEIWPLKP